MRIIQVIDLKAAGDDLVLEFAAGNGRRVNVRLTCDVARRFVLALGQATRVSVRRPPSAPVK